MASTNQQQLAGVIGVFEGPGPLLKAAHKVHDARYQYFDVFTPYPIHGMDAAMGLKRSAIPYVTFLAGLTGCLLGFLLQYWTSAVDWPLIVGGKPFNSWPAFVPVMFECTVLFAALSTVGAMFAFNGLPNMKRRIFDPGITRDKFVLAIETGAPLDPEDTAAVEKAKQYKAFNEAEATEFLKQLGAKEIRSVYAEGWF
jgi:hypothetical protein